jgi:hypothetical protein
MTNEDDNSCGNLCPLLIAHTMLHSKLVHVVLCVQFFTLASSSYYIAQIHFIPRCLLVVIFLHICK